MSTVVTDDQAKEYIAANVARLLKSRGMNQTELAKATNETKMTISRTVHGRHIPGAGILARIAEALDVTVDRLLAEPPNEKSRRTA